MGSSSICLALLFFVVSPRVPEAPSSVRPEPARAAPRLTLPPPSARYSDADYLEQVALPFYRRHLVDSFAVEGSNIVDAVDRQEILHVRERLAVFYASSFRPGVLDPDTRGQAERLARKGCKDPAILLAYSMTPYDYDFTSYKKPNLLRTGLHVCGHGTDALWPVLFNLMGLRCGWDGRATASSRKGLVEACRNAMPVLGAADSRLVVRLLMFDSRSLSMRCDELDPALPGLFADDYVRNCLAAGVKMGEAAAARGSGWASNVSREGWNGWEQGNAAAAEHLAAAIAARPDSLEAHMLRASLGARRCGDEIDPFAEMNAAFAVSLDAMSFASSTIHFFSSRWGGSTERLHRWAVDSANCSRTDTMLPYYGCVFALDTTMRYEFDDFHPKDAIAARVFTPDLRDAIYGMTDRYLAETNRTFLPSTNLFVCTALATAVYARDWPRIAHYRSLLVPGEARDWNFLRDVSVPQLAGFYDPLVRVLTDGASELSTGIVEAETRVNSGDLDGAIAAYGRLLEGPANRDSTSRSCCSQRLFELRVDRGIARQDGGWIDISAMPGRGEARCFYDQITVGTDGVARAEHGRRNRYSTYKALPVRNVSYRATIHFLPTKSSGPREIVWSLVHHISDTSDHHGAPQLRFDRDAAGVDRCQIRTIRKHVKGGYDILADIPLAKADQHDFELTRADGRITVKLDGKDVFDMAEAEFYRDSWIDGENYYLEPGRGLPIWWLNERGTDTGFSHYAFRIVHPTAP